MISHRVTYFFVIYVVFGFSTSAFHLSDTDKQLSTFASHIASTNRIDQNMIDTSKKISSGGNQIIQKNGCQKIYCGIIDFLSVSVSSHFETIMNVSLCICASLILALLVLLGYQKYQMLLLQRIFYRIQKVEKISISLTRQAIELTAFKIDMEKHLKNDIYSVVNKKITNLESITPLDFNNLLNVSIVISPKAIGFETETIKRNEESTVQLAEISNDMSQKLSMSNLWKTLLEVLSIKRV